MPASHVAPYVSNSIEEHSDAYVSIFYLGAYAAPYASISIRQLSRPDKSGNSRFEYAKILNILISGLASLRTKSGAYVSKFLFN
ncbi:MAG TPA: hypothetical protein PK899_03850 [Spirochaetota bacterium]|nr:hypothetical protein [Spirochaetota bacterium]